MKKVFALFIVICFAFVLGACHYQYYNDGSDYAAPGFKQGETLAVSYVPKTHDDLSDFERNFITEIFGENYGFAGYDAMTQADKAKIVAYFKEYNEGYYSVGFDNGFFYTFNELEGKETYSIPWGYESLSDKIPEPDFGTKTKSSFSEALGFISEYSDVSSAQAEAYCAKITEKGFVLDYEEEVESNNQAKGAVNRIYENSYGYTVNVIFSDNIFRLNISAPSTAEKENSK